MSTNAEAVRRTAEIPEWKREEVDEIVAFLDRYGSVGVVSIAGIPSRQLQLMRRDLHGAAELRVSRNSLLARALEEVDDGVEDLADHLSGQVGLIGTNDNPFGLYRQLEASKTPAPISAGETAPNDIIIEEGDTGIDPGPFVGELQQVGADARIMEGSIQVTADSLVAEEGDVVSDELAAVLAELEIEPKEVGLDLRVVYSDGILFEAADLELDIDEYREDVRAGVSAARSLSIEAAFPTPATVADLLTTADQAGRSLGLAAGIEDPAVLPDLVRRADASVTALAGRIDDEEALPEALRDVEAASDATEATATEQPAEDDVPDEAAADADADDADDEGGDEDDEDGDNAEGLGAMFG